MARWSNRPRPPTDEEERAAREEARKPRLCRLPDPNNPGQFLCKMILTYGLDAPFGTNRSSKNDYLSTELAEWLRQNDDDHIVSPGVEAGEVMVQFGSEHTAFLFRLVYSIRLFENAEEFAQMQRTIFTPWRERQKPPLDLWNENARRS